MKEGIKEGKEEEKRNVAKRMLQKNIPISEIVELTELSESEIKKLV